MTDGWHVSAADIILWAQSNSREAQEKLPLLVQKLVFASVDPLSLEIPTGDSIVNPGWDGVLTVKTGNAYVPCGTSCWEFSTEKDHRQKAERDYCKRVSNPLGFNTKDTTIVFVTCRKWGNSRNWVASKKLNNDWKDVKIIDADILESWLRLCPSVHRWLAMVIGKLSSGVWTLEQAWGSWSCTTSPESNYDLAIAGRLEEEKQLTELLGKKPSHIVVSADWGEEAYAFVLSVVAKHSKFSSRLLVVKDQKEWDSLIDARWSLILVPKFDDLTNIGYAVRNNHWVITTVSSSTLSQSPQVPLRKPAKISQVDALIEMGIRKELAETVVNSSRGYLSVLRRHPILNSGNFEKPLWAEPEKSPLSIAVLFAGSWIADNEDDRQILSLMAHVSYSEVDKELHSLMLTGDPLAERIGSRWRIVSYREAWKYLCQNINSQSLGEFCESASTILSESDPRFELAPEVRWMADAYGKKTKHSKTLRHGVSKMFAILGSYGDADCKLYGAFSIQDRISSCVSKLLKKDMTERDWYSLSEEIVFLAEAAPEVFLEVIENDLKKEKPPILALFIEEGTMGGCPHAGLLAGLEIASWNLDFLARVTGILSTLARLDPGGRYTNRPFNSLKAIFQGNLPQTKATLQQRLEIIDWLVGKEPDIAWKLMINIIPEARVLSSIGLPRFRNWAKGWKATFSQQDYYNTKLFITERLLNLANNGPQLRWVDIIKELPNFPIPTLEKALDELKNKGDNFPQSIREIVCSEIRTLLTNHREFSNAYWALPQKYVDELDEIYQKLIPADIIAKYTYLFDSPTPPAVNVASGMDYQQKYDLIEKQRVTALEEIWQNIGFKGIESLAANIKFPKILGVSIGKCSFAQDVELSLISWLGVTNNPNNETAMGYVNIMSVKETSWTSRVHKEYSKTWSDNASVAFCLSLPLNDSLFQILDSSNENIRKNFWEKITRYYLSKEEGKFSTVILNGLLSNNRPFAALEVASYCLHNSELKKHLSLDLCAKALELAVIQAGDAQNAGPTVGYGISEILSIIQSDPSFDSNRLARIEWMYLPLMESWEIQPVQLINKILSDASFFVEIVCLMYNPNPPIVNEFSSFAPDLRKLLAKNSWLLMNLIKRLPGQYNSNEIDGCQLQNWVEAVRQSCSQRNRKEIGDECIGQVLSYSPFGKDGLWPHEIVREIIERINSDNLEQGVRIGRENQRGVTSRAVGDGGNQERKLSEEYQNYSDKIKFTSPRTALMLHRIAESYTHLATQMDHDDGLLSV
jgi:hypothetical protein